MWLRLSVVLSRGTVAIWCRSWVTKMSKDKQHWLHHQRMESTESTSLELIAGSIVTKCFMRITCAAWRDASLA